MSKNAEGAHHTERTCLYCSFVYDEAKGDPDSGVAPGTRWEDLPEDWCCPVCGSDQSGFEKN